MKRKKYFPSAGGKATLAMAILSMAVGLNITASAAGTDQNQDNDSGKTTVRVGVARELPQNISFEVPLYYTAAIVKTDPDQNNGRSNMIVYPKEYYIENRSLETDPKKENPKELVVANVEVASVKGATWNLVEDLDGTETSTDMKMAARIGGLKLPTITAGDDKLKEINVRKQTSAFYKKNASGDSGVYQVLGDHNGDGIHDDNGRMDLDVELQIPAGYVPSNKKTVAQFRVVYTLSTRNADGTIVGKYDQAWVNRDYKGPKKATASDAAKNNN